MPEQGTAVMAPDTTASNGADNEPASIPPGNTDDGYYAGTYKTRDEAERGIREKDLAVNRAFAERDKLTAQVKDMTDSFRKIAEAKTNGESRPEPIDRKALVLDVDERGGAAVLDVFEKFARETDAEYDRRLADIKKDYDARLEIISKTLRNQDPEYATNKERIAEVAQEMGLDPDINRDLLLKVVRVMNKQTNPDRPPIPGNSSTPAMTRSSQLGTLDAKSWDLLQTSEIIGKITPEEAKKLAGIRADTVERRREGTVRK